MENLYAPQKVEKFMEEIVLHSEVKVELRMCGGKIAIYLY